MHSVPILFLIFINDIANCMSHSTLRCFADDTRICRSISDLNNVHELQSDLEEVTKWSERNNMALHEDKFEYICHLANKRNPLHQLPFAHEHFQYTTSAGTTLTPVAISSVIWALQFPVICPGHHTYDLVVIRQGRWPHRFSVSSTLAILASC